MSAPGHVEAATARARGSACAATPVRQVSGYSVPGEGSSTAIAVVTVVALLLLWWVATHNGWIRDIFLPQPERIITSFADAWKGDIQGGRPLYEHFGWSLFRVFLRLRAGLRDRDSRRHRDGSLAHRTRHLRPTGRVLPSAAAACACR